MFNFRNKKFFIIPAAIMTFTFPLILSGCSSSKSADVNSPVEPQLLATGPAAAEITSSVATSTSEEPSELINVPETLPDGSKKYTSQQYGFSLVYPRGFALSEYREGGGARTLVFEEEKGERGFQIYVTPYEGKEVSPERFKVDEPSGVYDNPAVVIIDGVEATSFFGENSVMGRTREVWFIKNGYLYEVNTYAELDSWFAEIMKSWKFVK